MHSITWGSRRPRYWLQVKNGRNGIEVLTTDLPNGGRALPVFSFEEEADRFLYLRGAQGDWRPRETSPGELLSISHTLLVDIDYVTLDPIPEIPHLDVLDLLSITREEFMGRLERTRKNWVVEERYSSLMASGCERPAQRIG